MTTKLEKCLSIDDLRRVAKKRLPASMFHYIDGGADDEWTMRRNRAAFEDYQLVPRMLRDVSAVDTSTTLFGAKVSAPIMLAPTGMSRLFHHEKEIGVARAAEKAGMLYSLSTMATTAMEDIADLSTGPKMFQMYILRDRGLTADLVARAKASGYDALCLTVDTPLAGNRQRDAVYGMTMPPRITAKNLSGFMFKWHWLVNLLLSPRFDIANVSHMVDALGAQGPMGLIAYVNSQFDRALTWDDVAWLRDRWTGPLVIKGLLSPPDVKLANEFGANAVMVSNHGGRQLDTVPSPMDQISRIREVVGTDLQLVLDGGVRRGTDVLKALAIGADAVSIGRPYLYGLAAGGEAGVARALTILQEELARDMALLGVKSASDIDAGYLQSAGR